MRKRFLSVDLLPYGRGSVKITPMNAPGLLVSVRSVAESLCALEGGAAIIDVKEPRLGSLGRAADSVIHGVASAVGDARPVSAALGEWADDARTIPSCALSYVKWGLAGCARHPDWHTSLMEKAVAHQHPQIVFVAYADWQCAQAPPVEEVVALACRRPGSVLLIDTHCKDAQFGKQRPTLLDWLPMPSIKDLRARCQESRVRLALAGSLGRTEIETLLHVRPDWFAVRGAACDANDRASAIQTEKVRALVELIRSKPV